MEDRKDVTGLLVSFIGMIISLFIGFGFILTLIGMCMMPGESFKKARNSLIGSFITSIAGFFVIIAVSSAVTMLFSGIGGAAIGGLVTFIIAAIVMFILLYIFNRNSYTNMMYGCEELAREKKDTDLAQNCLSTARKYQSALLAYTIISVLAAAFIWVPILNILLIITAIGIGIWYFVMQIFLIIRLWQTYSLCK